MTKPNLLDFADVGECSAPFVGKLPFARADIAGVLSNTAACVTACVAAGYQVFFV